MGSSAGYRLAGVRVRAVGRDKLEDGRAYLFISNHASNLDPPIITFRARPAHLRSSPSRSFSRFRFLAAPCALVILSRSIGGQRAAAESVREAVGRATERGLQCWYFRRERDHLMADSCRSKRGRSIWQWKPGFLWSRSPSLAAMRRGRREACRSAGEVVVNFHPPIDPHQFERKEDLLAAVRAAIDSALPAPYRELGYGRTSLSVMLIPAPTSKATSGRTLRAKIKASKILLSRLILKLDGEFAWSSDWRRVLEYYQNGEKVATEWDDSANLPISIQGTIPDGTVKQYSGKNDVIEELEFKNGKLNGSAQ